MSGNTSVTSNDYKCLWRMSSVKIIAATNKSIANQKKKKIEK